MLFHEHAVMRRRASMTKGDGHAVDGWTKDQRSIETRF